MRQHVEPSILAAAAEVSTVAGWIHLCVTAAEEATAAAKEAANLPTPETVGEAIRVVRQNHQELNGARGFDYIVKIIKAYQFGQLLPPGDAAAVAFRASLPPLSSRANTQAFIACVAVGLARQLLSAADATKLVYTAQCALSAYPKRKRGAAIRA
jgi:hypothetical protein